MSFHVWETMQCEQNNTTYSVLEKNSTGDKVLYENMYHVLYGYGLPTICACGFLGNVLNLVILGGRRMQRTTRSDQSANIGLIALAVADMNFCISAFPSTFLPKDNVFHEKGFLLYYGFSCAAIINIFIMTSTWLTVTMATERFLAICYPLRSRKLLTLQRTKVCIIIVYVISAVFNIPVFWRFNIIENSCRNLTTYSLKQRPLFSEDFDHAYRAIWAVVGNFVPLLMLLVFNIGLMREIHKSYALRRTMSTNAGIHSSQGQQSEAHNRITITLISIVVMFFILVSPSEIMKHIAYLLEGDLSTNYTYMTIEVVTNMMQTINFSANFILYCIINPSFRRTMKEMLCFQYMKLKYSDGLDASFVEGNKNYRKCASMRLGSPNGKVIETHSPNSKGYIVHTMPIRAQSVAV